MKSSECRDKQIMELSGSKDKASFNFFNPDEESDEEFDPHPSYGFRPVPPLAASHSRPSLVRNSSSMDYIDSVKVTREKVGMEFVSEINQTIKEHFENLLHVVDGLSARLSQLESKTHQLENAVDDLKVSAEYNSGRTDGKLRQLENILREVQDDIHFLRDRQEIAETQLQLAKLQVSKSNRQSEDQKTAPVQADSSLKALPSVSEQSSQPCPNAPSTILHQNAKPAGAPLAMDLHTQIAPNPIPSTPQPQSYYLPTGNILESTYQQYNVPPAQQEQPPPPVPSQLYQPASNLPQASKSPEQAQLHPPPWTPPPPVPSQLYQPTSSLPQVPQSPELPQLHPPPWNPPPPVPSQLYQPTSSLPQVSQSPELPQLHPRPWTPPPPVPSQLCQPTSNLPPVSQSPQTQPPWMAHHPEETPSMPSHNYQPAGGPSMQQFYMDSSQRMPEQLSRRPYSEFAADFSDMRPYSGSPSHYSRSTMKPSQFSPSSPPVRDGGNNYMQLPKAQILPHALPTASTVDAGSSSGRTGNKVSADDVVDKVTAMGFRRDVARATVRKLTENGQTVDLNAVLDKLMNNDGDGQPHKGWSGR
ncbi:hypothetical protein ACSBR2_023896 [Camellia fascicularis]